jgi:hypothetical protein
MLENFKFGIQNKTIYIGIGAFIALIILMVAVYFMFFRNKKPKFTNVKTTDQHQD